MAIILNSVVIYKVERHWYIAMANVALNDDKYDVQNGSFRGSCGRSVYLNYVVPWCKQKPVKSEHVP